MVVCYAVFHISTVFALGYGTRVAHLPRGVFLQVLCAGTVVMGIVAAASDFAMAPLLGMGTPGGALAFVCLDLALMGLAFAPTGALLPSLFPAEVRCTGAPASPSSVSAACRPSGFASACPPR